MIRIYSLCPVTFATIQYRWKPINGRTVGKKSMIYGKWEKCVDKMKEERADKNQRKSVDHNKNRNVDQNGK